MQSHSLYNSCAARDKDPHWERRAFQVQKMYWADDRDVQFDEHQGTMASLKQYLTQIRQKVSTQLMPVTPLIEQLQCERDRLRSKQNLLTITQFMSAVYSVSSTTTSLMTMFASLIFSKAACMCSRGKAPCSFSVVGMGSLAKGETTPYSELEFLFLIERKTAEIMKFFEKLAVTVYFMIGNMKETKLKYMNIEELKGWFDDKSINGFKIDGFKIDGLSVNAGNIPTGNESTQPRYRMIMTVDEAALWYERVFTMPDKKESIRGDESAMLSTTCHIHGEKRLHEYFTDRISSLLQNSTRKVATKSMISDDIEKFVFLPEGELVEIRNVKEDLFRFPSLMVFDLRQYHQLWVRDSWAVIEELRRLSIISGEVWLSLKFLYSVGIYCRLAAYQRCGSQVEDFSVLHTTETYQLPKPVLIHLFLHLIPMREALKQYITLGNSASLRTQLPGDDNLALALTHYYYGDYRQFNELIDERCEGNLGKLDIDMRLMYVCSLTRCQRYDTAKTVMNSILDTERVNLGNFVSCCSFLASACYKDSQYHKSLAILARAERHLKSRLRNVSHPAAATVYEAMGYNYDALGEYDSALQHFKKSLNVQLSMYGYTDHPDIARSYNGMANVYHSQGNHTKALQCYEKSLKMRLSIYGHIDHPDIAISYHKVASMFHSQGEYRKALQ